MKFSTSDYWVLFLLEEMGLGNVLVRMKRKSHAKIK